MTTTTKQRYGGARYGSAGRASAELATMKPPATRKQKKKMNAAEFREHMLQEIKRHELRALSCKNPADREKERLAAESAKRALAFLDRLDSEKREGKVIHRGQKKTEEK